MALSPLTERQEEVLEFFSLFRDERGYPPTMKDICEEFGWASRNWAHQVVDQLVRKGYLERDAHVARGLRMAGGR